MNDYRTILQVTNQTLDALNTKAIDTYQHFHDASCYHSNSGREHYRLLQYLSSKIDNALIYDIGTNACRSAIALSTNRSNKVKSYDIVQINPVNPIIENVEWIIGDAIEDANLLKADVIFLDVSHDGAYENLLYDHLVKHNWKGLLILDDIHLNDAMRQFWNKITQSKIDLTYIGHWSGTGAVFF